MNVAHTLLQTGTVPFVPFLHTDGDLAAPFIHTDGGPGRSVTSDGGEAAQLLQTCVIRYHRQGRGRSVSADGNVVA